MPQRSGDYKWVMRWRLANGAGLLGPRDEGGEGAEASVGREHEASRVELEDHS
jgi:hypothetical protein